MDRKSLLALRRKFAGLPYSFHKDMGLRKIREALWFASKPHMAVETRRLGIEAERLLPYAEAAR